MESSPFSEITRLDASKAFVERLNNQLAGEFVILQELDEQTTYLAEKSGGDVCEYCGERTENLFVHLLNECEAVSADQVSGNVGKAMQEDYDLESAFEGES